MKRFLALLLCACLCFDATFALAEAIVSTPEPTVTAAPTAEPTAEPTVVPTEEPPATPEPAVTEEPTAAPTEEPTATPEPAVTEEPTAAPTEAPTATPEPAVTEEPTVAPTEEPTATPEPAVTEEPTAAPTEEPTATPEPAVTEEPTAAPTEEPTATPEPAVTEEPAATPEASEEPVVVDVTDKATLSAVALTLPSKPDVGQDIRIELTGTDVSLVEWFRLTVRDGTSNTSPVLFTVDVQDTFYVIPAATLPGAGAYYFEADIYAADDTDPLWRGGYQYISRYTALTAPEIYMPEGPEPNEDLTLTWNSVPNADSYTVKVLRYSSEKHNSGRVTGTSYTIPASIFPSKGDYEIVVIAHDDDLCYNDVSVTFTVKVALHLILQVESGKPVGSSVSINWTHTSDHDNYKRIMTLTGPDGTKYYSKKYLDAVGPFVVPEGVLRKAGTYTVSMYCSSCGTISTVEKTFTLTGEDLPDPALNLKATTSAQWGDPLSFSWTAVPEATEYTITINGNTSILSGVEPSFLLTTEAEILRYRRLVEGENTVTIAVSEGRYLVSETVKIYLSPAKPMEITGVSEVHKQFTPLFIEWTDDPRAAFYMVKLYTPTHEYINSEPYGTTVRDKNSFTFEQDEFIQAGNYRIVVEGKYASSTVCTAEFSFRVEAEELRILSYTGYVIYGQQMSLTIAPYPNAIRYEVHINGSHSTSATDTGENLTIKPYTQGHGTGTVDVTVEAYATYEGYHSPLQTKTVKVTIAPLPSTVVIRVGEEYNVERHASAHMHINMYLGFRTRASNYSVLECTWRGSVIGKRAGTATLTIDNYLGDSYRMKFIVGTKAKSIKITGPSSLCSGTSATLRATVSPSNASVKSVQWKMVNSGGGAASLSSSGKLTAKAVTEPTQVTVRAISKDGSGVYKDYTLTITPGVSSIVLFDEEYNTLNGRTLTMDMNNGIPYETDNDLDLILSADVQPANALQTLTWKSSNTKVAKITSAGRLIAVADGTATITATAKDGSGKKASFTVKVVHKPHSISAISGRSSLTAGQSITLKASVGPSNATSKSIKWSTSNKAIATVDSKGVVKGVSQGEVVITATASGNGAVQATKTITVLPKATSVRIYNGETLVNSKTITLDLNIKQTAALTAMLLPDNAAQAVTWKSSDTKIATVSSAGNVTPKKEGSVTITATAKDGSKKSAKVTIKVTRLATRVTLTGARTISVGQTATLKGTAVGASSKSLSWVSSNTAVLTVNSKGAITAKTEGTAIVTATARDGSGKSASLEITVLPRTTLLDLMLDGVSIRNQTIVLDLNAKQTITPTVATQPENASKAVTWKSSSTSVATVASNGKVTPKKEGTVTITATAKDGSKKSAKFTVKVTRLATRVTLTGANTITLGQTATLKGTAVGASNKGLTWTSSNPDVLTVNSKGGITPVTEGTATITAAARDGSGKSASLEITVLPRTTLLDLMLDGVSIKGQTVVLDLNAKQTITPTVATEPENASKAVTWKSSSSTIATVASNGKIIPKKEGTATITATAKDGTKKTASFTVKVTRLATRVTLTGANTITLGQTATLKGTAVGASNKGLTWTSSNPDVLTVSSKGVITAVAEGTATVTATTRDGSGKSASLEITVLPKVTAMDLLNANGDSVLGTTITLRKSRKETITLKVSVQPENASPSVTWKSGNTKVVNVSSTGKITIVGTGTTTVTATARDGSGKSVRVTIKVVK